MLLFDAVVDVAEVVAVVPDAAVDVAVVVAVVDAAADVAVVVAVVDAAADVAVVVAISANHAGAAGVTVKAGTRTLLQARPRLHLRSRELIGVSSWCTRRCAYAVEEASG